MTIAVAFGLMGALFMAGLYVAGALGVLALVMMYFYSDAPLWNIMANRAWTTYTDFILVAIPLFILMGELVLRSGVAERMYQTLSHWVSFIPGGLMHTNIASCAVFAACSGHSVATAATISRVSLPSFRARGYDERLVVGSLAAGGTLGILIPPSILLVLYGLTTGVSVGRLFLAGFIPGLVLSIAFMMVIALIAKIWPGVAPREHPASWRLRITSLVAMLPVFFLVFLVLGSIYFGWATPTEAAGAGVTGALALAVLNKSGPLAWAALLRLLNLGVVSLLLPPALAARLRELRRANPVNLEQFREAALASLRMFQDAALSTIRTTGMIMLILMAAFTLQFAFAYLRISTEMAEWVTGFNLSPLQLILILIVFYLVLGTFMESHSMMLTTLPLLFPVLVAAEIDLLWFGIIMIILLEAAQVSPPQGLTLYVLHGARREVAAEIAEAEGVAVEETGTINDVYIGVLPFMVCMVVVIGLVIAFPEIVLWLPDQVKGPR